MTERIRVGSGGPWEAKVGYSRAVRVGDRIFVAGTTATQGDDVACEGDAYGQTRFALDVIEEALRQAGASLSDVVRTRIFTTDISRWEEIGKAHGEFFAEVRPVLTMVEVRALIDPRLLVEIEAEAVLG